MIAALGAVGPQEEKSDGSDISAHFITLKVNHTALKWLRMKYLLKRDGALCYDLRDCPHACMVYIMFQSMQ